VGTLRHCRQATTSPSDPVPVAFPTKGDIRARGFDAAEKADCSIGGGSNAVSVLLI
jgi:hypothetical protein